MADVVDDDGVLCRIGVQMETCDVVRDDTRDLICVSYCNAIVRY